MADFEGGPFEVPLCAPSLAQGSGRYFEGTSRAEVMPPAPVAPSSNAQRREGVASAANREAMQALDDEREKISEWTYVKISNALKIMYERSDAVGANKHASTLDMLPSVLRILEHCNDLIAVKEQDDLVFAEVKAKKKLARRLVRKLTKLANDKGATRAELEACKAEAEAELATPEPSAAVPTD